MKLNIISVPVTDQQRAKEFYLKMGLTIVRDAPMGNNQMWIQMAFPGGGVNITLVTWFSKMPAGCLHGATLLVNDIEAEKNRLEKAGVPVGKIDAQPWGKFAPVTDPDGNSWFLHQE